MADRYLNPHGVETFWAAIKNRFVQKEAGKGLSSNDYTAAEKTKLSSLPAAADILTDNDKGAANGVAPLNANGVIPGEYIPGSGETDSYVVEVQTSSFLDPTADEDELKAIIAHYEAGERCELKVYPDDSGTHGFYIGHLTFSTGSIFKFTVYHNLESAFYIFSVNTTEGTIEISEEIVTDDHIVEKGSDDHGWHYSSYSSTRIHAYKQISIDMSSTSFVEIGSTGLYYADFTSNLPSLVAESSLKCVNVNFRGLYKTSEGPGTFSSANNMWVAGVGAGYNESGETGTLSIRFITTTLEVSEDKVPIGDFTVVFNSTFDGYTDSETT